MNKAFSSTNITDHAKTYMVNNSHHPDLTERLIEAHRTLQMSREYLENIYTNQGGHRAADELADAMVALEQAIAAL